MKFRLPQFFLFFLLANNLGFSIDSLLNPITHDLPPIIEQVEINETELNRLDRVIQATQQNLEKQKAIRNDLIEYMQLQDLYAANSKDNDHLLRMAKSANRLLEKIKENHLLQTFSSDFISELTIFAQLANKRGIPKP